MKFAIECGDYLDVIKKIPDKTIDLIVTDPPYLHIKGGCKSKKLNVGCRDANSKVVSEMSDFGKSQIYTFLDNVKCKMKKVNMYVFASKLQLPYYLNWALENKLQFDVLFWYKNTTRMISTKFYSSNVEYIVRIYANGCALRSITKENGKADSELYQKFFIYDSPNKSKKLCETQKPLAMIERIIMLSSDEGDIVLDPFMGSGTMGVACRNLRRSFIGIDNEPNICEVARDRIKRGLD